MADTNTIQYAQATEGREIAKARINGQFINNNVLYVNSSMDIWNVIMNYLSFNERLHLSYVNKFLYSNYFHLELNEKRDNIVIPYYVIIQPRFSKLTKLTLYNSNISDISRLCNLKSITIVGKSKLDVRSLIMSGIEYISMKYVERSLSYVEYDSDDNYIFPKIYRNNIVTYVTHENDTNYDISYINSRNLYMRGNYYINDISHMSELQVLDISGIQFLEKLPKINFKSIKRIYIYESRISLYVILKQLINNCEIIYDEYNCNESDLTNCDPRHTYIHKRQIKMYVDEDYKNYKGRYKKFFPEYDELFF